MSWQIVEFDRKYQRAAFNCGTKSLDDYVRQYITQDLKRGLTKAYFAVQNDPPDIVVGYYTVCSARVGNTFCTSAPFFSAR